MTVPAVPPTTEPGWLDHLPRFWRHLIIGVLFTVLAWASSDLMPAVSPWLAAHPPLGPAVGVLVAQLLLIVTPLVRTYGLTWAGGSSGRHEAGSGRPLFILCAAVVFLLAGAAGPAVASGARAPRVPEIVTGVVECGSGGVLLSVRVLTLDRHAAGTWVERPGGDVRLQAWFQGGWRAASVEVLAPDTRHSVEGWGRWRPYLVTPGGLVFGPAWSVPGDLCTPSVERTLAGTTMGAAA